MMETQHRCSYNTAVHERLTEELSSNIFMTYISLVIRQRYNKSDEEGVFEC